MKVREPVYDLLKAAMMLLIIGGHLVGLKVIVPSERVGVSYFENFRIAIEMPVFFIISGYFAWGALDGRKVGKIAKNLSNFIWPAIAFGWLFGMILFLCGRIDLLAAVKYPVVMLRGLWFLRVLFFVYLVSALICLVARTTIARTLLFGVAYLAFLFNPIVGHHWIMHEEPHMFPFFVFGLLILRQYDWHKNWKIALACGLVFLGMIFSEGDVGSNGMSFYAIDPTWRASFGSMQAGICTMGRLVVGMAGTVFLLWAVDRLLAFVPQLSLLATFGTTTLGVYVMHQWLLAQLAKGAVFPVSNCFQWPFALLTFLCCHFLVKGLGVNPYVRRTFFSLGELILDCVAKRKNV